MPFVELSHQMPMETETIRREAPREEATFDFVIFAMARTGSNHLCARLNAAGATCHFELFHSKHIYYGARLTTNWTLEQRNEDPAGFMAAVKQLTPHARTGCKIFPGHLRDSSFVIEDAGIRKVILYRENLLAAFASSRQAQAMGKFVHQANREPPKVHFDPMDFARYRRHVARWYGGLLDQLSALGQGFFVYPYSMVNSRSHFRALLRFLDLTGDAPPTTRHRKGGTNDIVGRFENPDEVRTHLVEGDLEGWEHEVSTAIW